MHKNHFQRLLHGLLIVVWLFAGLACQPIFSLTSSGEVESTNPAVRTEFADLPEVNDSGSHTDSAIQVSTPTPEKVLPGITQALTKSGTAGQRFQIELASHSTVDSLDNIALRLIWAEVGPDTLTLHLAFQYEGEKPMSLEGGELEAEFFHLEDSYGNDYIARKADPELLAISPPDGFAPGGAAVGNVVFPLPSAAGPYTLNLPESLGYAPLQFNLDSLLIQQDDLLPAPGEYRVGASLYSTEEVLAKVALEVRSMRVTGRTIEFEIAFMNKDRKAFTLITGPSGWDAWLLDADGRQYRPVQVSASLEESIAPDEGWQPDQAHDGTISFPIPEAGGSFRFIFSAYSPLSLRFNPDGSLEVSVTSATGGAPPPTPTLTAEDVTYAETERLLSRLSAALLSGDKGAYLATFSPELQAEQAAILERIKNMPLASYTVSPQPGSELPTPEVQSLVGFPVAIRYTLMDIPEDNYFIHTARIDLERLGGELKITRFASEDFPPFWWDGEVIFETTEHFLLFSRPEMKEDLPELGEEAETAYQFVLDKGLTLEPRYVAYITATQDDFQKLTGRPAFIVGVASSRYGFSGDTVEVNSRAFYMNGEAFQNRRYTTPDARQLTITHELVHLALSDGTRPFTPPWLSEGAAVYYSGESTAAMYSRLLNNGYLDNLTLEALTSVSSLGQDESSHEQVDAEYIFSGATFAYLVETFGEQETRDFYYSYASVPISQVREKIPSSSGAEVGAALLALQSQITRQAVQDFFDLTLEELDAAVKAWLEQSVSLWDQTGTKNAEIALASSFYCSSACMGTIN